MKIKDFGKNKLIATLVIFLVLIVGLATTIVVILVQKAERETISAEINQIMEQEFQFAEKAEKKADEILDKLNNEPNYSLENAIDDFKNVISESDGRERFYLETTYANFLYLRMGDLERAIAVLDDMKDSVTEEYLAGYYMTYRNLYLWAGDTEKAEEYDQKMSELMEWDGRFNF